MPAPKSHKPYPGCETGGRPPRYSTEDIERYAEELKAWMIDPSHIWFKDFCLDRDLDPDFMSEWAKLNEKFNGAYKMAKHRQESRLVNGGLTNQFNAGFTKFVLTNVHNWEREINHDTKTHVERLAESIRDEPLEETEDGDQELEQAD